ncbi:hypothetical protein J6W78_06030 [bacterium]|nr:hypothetical protein [bacterium]
MKKLFVSAIAIFACLLSFNLFADSECTGISIENIEYNSSSKRLVSTDVTGLDFADGETAKFQIEFYADELTADSYDLGSEKNANYKTCDECARIFHYNAAGDGLVTQYFQESGTLELSYVDTEGASNGVISAKLVEVTIDSSNGYQSTPVENGKCVEIETAAWDTACIPQCEGKSCGSDGCGGSCGTCDGQACGADFQCTPFNCSELSIGEFELVVESDYYGDHYYYYDAYTTGNGIGSASVPDLFEISFIADELTTGIVDLTGDIGDAYVILYEDYDVENNSTKKYYFQESGSLNFTEVKEGTFESRGTGSVRLVEVDTDIVPVAGGKCYTLDNFAWDTVCVPQCEGKQCGPDGCGGTCGEGCSVDQTCNAEFQCVADSCTTITLDTTNVTFDDYYMSYYMPYTPNSGGEYDTFSLQLYYVDPVIGTHELAGTNYADETGVFIFVYDETDSDDYKTYFQKKGQVKVTAYDEEAGNITAELKDVKLAEVTINEDDYSTVPVAGGKCYEIQNVTFSYPAGEGNDPTDPTTDPTNPTTDPTEPTTDPTEPTTDPTEPTSDPADTGDTGDTDNDPADTGDTEVPGDDTSDTGSAPSDGDTDTTPADGDDTPADGDDTTPTKESKKSSGCSVVTL